MTGMKTQFMVYLGTVTMLAACSSTSVRTQAPNLAYQSQVPCTDQINFDETLRRSTDEKQRKREARRRTILINANMAGFNTPCLSTGNDADRPYAVFEIPTGFKGAVVTAGSQSDARTIFAANITTHAANGDLVRSFTPEDYRRYGALYGVQFAPRPVEALVLVRADPSLVGDQEKTVETSTDSRLVIGSVGTNYGSGRNTVGRQNAYSRTYAYNGTVTLRMIFPKQD